MKILRWVFIAIMMLLAISLNNPMQSATFEITSNTNWSAIIGGPPTSADLVSVKNGATLTIDVADAICKDITLGANNPLAGNGTLLFNAGSQLTVDPSSSGIFQFGSGSYSGVLDMTAGGKLICAELFVSTGGSFIPGTGTIEIRTTAVSQLPSEFSTYNNIIANGTGSVKLSTPVTINGYLDVQQGTFFTDISQAFALTVMGDVDVAPAAEFNLYQSYFTLGGNMNNTGDLQTGSNTTELTGNDQFLTGCDSMMNLIINGTGVVTFMSDVLITDTLTMNAGNIIINDNSLTIGKSGIINGFPGPSGYIIADSTGVVQKDFNTTQSFTYPIGDIDEYSPVTMTLSSGTTFGTHPYISVNVTDARHPDMLSSHHISRYWSVNSYDIPAINYNFSAMYTSADVEGIEDIIDGAIWDGGIWTEYDDADTVNNNVFSTTGITVIPSNFAFSGGNVTLLPIDLLTFEGEVEDDCIELNWATASELNNAYFTIEKSDDGEEFEEAYNTTGAGNSSVVSEYSYRDYDPVTGTNYYKLRQTDYNGKSSFSEMIAAEYYKNSRPAINIYPNPASHGQVNITVEGLEYESILVVLYNLMGETIYSKVCIISNGQFATAIDLEEKLPSGIYLVIGSNSDKELFKKKLIIQ